MFQDDEREFGLMIEHDYVAKYEDTISVSFYTSDPKLSPIGKKMEKINKNAKMNGYSWEAFFNYYLPKYFPDVCVNMETDSENGMYAVYYENTPENERRAKQFNEIINNLIENEDELYRIVREEGDSIEWDSFEVSFELSDDTLKDLSEVLGFNNIDELKKTPNLYTVDELSKLIYNSELFNEFREKCREVALDEKTLSDDTIN